MRPPDEFAFVELRDGQRIGGCVRKGEHDAVTCFGASVNYVGDEDKIGRFFGVIDEFGSKRRWIKFVNCETGETEYIDWAEVRRWSPVP